MVAPFTADTVTVSPADPPEPLTVGVVSFVTLSVVDDPVSLTGRRSGVDAAGAVVSTVIDWAALAGETFPAGSVSVPVTVHVPSVTPLSAHDVPEPITYVHVFVVDPSVAEIVAVSPVVPPDTENAGLVEFVMLSADDAPRSVPVVRSGVPGAPGAVRSTVTALPSEAEPGPVTPPDEVTEPVASLGTTVPSVQPETVTVNVVVAPVVGVTENVQDAVPVLEKSAAETVVASTLPLNVSV